MERKIVLSLFYMGIITAIVGIVITTVSYYGFFRREVEENLVHECRLVAESYDKLSSADDVKQLIFSLAMFNTISKPPGF